jgi:hypothetical protein
MVDTNTTWFASTARTESHRSEKRFIDRDGQTGDPQDYIKAFNKKCGIAA